MGNTEITASKVVFVEGKDDRYVVEKLLEEEGLDGIQVVELEGKEKLIKLLSSKAVRGLDEVEVLAVMIDADRDPDAAFQSICLAFNKAGLPSPQRPFDVLQGKPSVVVYVLPDGKSQGMLEDLFAESINDLPESECIRDFLDCVEKIKGSSLRNRSKGTVYSYIATSERPQLRLGHAVASSQIGLSHPAFDLLRSSLRSL